MLKEKLSKHRILLNIAKVVRAWIYSLVWYPYIKYLHIKLKKSKDIIFYECYVKTSLYEIKINNWGDDLNKFFLEYITRKKFVFIPYSKLLQKNIDVHYSLIGSIIGFYNLNNTIIYGSGIQDPKRKIKGIPKKIHSVRGPLTREIMLKNNIECPERYGDPVLLLPLFYKPQIRKQKNICVIPNMGTMNYKKMTALDILIKEYDCKCIDMTRYEKWTDVIDEIASSSFIISESLHGLIVAETYGIPNVWVEFIEHPDYWDFKFLDYYESIGVTGKESEKLYIDFDWEKLLKLRSEWKKGDIDYKKMIEYFPFEIASDRLLLEVFDNE